MEFTFEQIGEEFLGDIGELSTLYEQCRFIRCDFTGMDLSGVTFVDCAFINCNWGSLKLNGTVLNDCYFEGSKLSGIHFRDLAQETLQVKFKECRIDSALFDTVTMENVQFGSSDLIRCEFSWSTFTGSDFSGCDFRESRFLNCTVEQCDFRNGSNLYLDLKENRVKGAKFSFNQIPELLESFGIELD